MKSRILIYVVLEIMLSAILFLVSSNIYITLIYFLIGCFFAVFDSLFLFKITKLDNIYKEGLNLVQNLIINIDSGQSLKESLASNQEVIDADRFKLFDESSETNNLSTVITKTYPFYFIKIFFEIYETYQTTGGKFIELANSYYSYVISLNREIDNYNKKSSSCLLSLFSLWVFSFLIIVISKFALTNYYEMMIKNSIFLILLLISFISFNLSLSFTIHTLYKRTFLRRIYEE